MTSMQAAKIGAVLYVLWGLLHIRAALTVYWLAARVPEDMGEVSGRVVQDAWHLGLLALFATVIAVRYNWHNDRLGYWLNLWVVSITDIGFIILILLPGYAQLPQGLIGPGVWLLALAFSTAGYRMAKA